MGEPLDLQALRSLAERATPGPWHADREGYDEVVRVRHGVVATLHRVSPGCERPNAAYLAALSPDRVLGLLDRLGSLEAREALRLAARSGSPHPVKQADEEGLAWFDVLTRSASPGTPCTIQVGFARALLERLQEAEAGGLELSYEVSEKAAQIKALKAERDQFLVRAQAAEARVKELEAERGQD